MTRPIKLQNSGTSGNFRRLVPSVGFPFDVPRRLRAFVRARETSLVLLAVVIGALGGLVVAAMSALVDLLHMVLFGLGPGERLSAQAHLDPSVAILVPMLGGLGLGLAGILIAHRRPAREVDPIEANALHGGRMSLRGSLIVAAQTVSGSVHRSAWKRAIPNSPAASPPSSGSDSACDAATCGCWSGAAPRPAPSGRRLPAPSMRS